jgi:LPPG:FO 2-phospho-L-lactate transferase
VNVTVLAGGVGAARFLSGLIQLPEVASVTAIVNTGDDTELHGLAICPDLDTITYTLAGAIDPDRGWGLAGETWHAMAALDRYEGVRPPGSSAAPTWFGLGDRDLATHFYRTARLREGATLTEVTAEIAAAWGIGIRLLPMTNDRFRTSIELADSGAVIGFQDYFVRLRHSVPIRSVVFDHSAQLTPEAQAAIAAADVIVIAPSNPILSVGPIRALPGVDELLAGRRSTVIAVSPIVGGAALKGPADRMLAELGIEPSVVGVAALYAHVAGALVIDPVDAPLAASVESLGMRCVVTPSVMSNPEISRDLARATIAAT